MAIDHRQVHFRTNDTSEVIGEITRILNEDTGREWITISPWVDPEHVPVTSALRRIFSARGSKVPEVTWVPPQGKEPAQVGVLHSRGADAYGYLIDEAAKIPPTWVMVSDHSKRGLLFGVHPDSTPDEVLAFSVEVAAVLADVPTDDRWIAQVSKSGA